MIEKTMKAVCVFVAIALVCLGVLNGKLHAQDVRSVWDAVYTVEQAERGRQQYNLACAACHGEQMNGGEMAPPLAGGAFLSTWNGATLGDLFERIRTTMPQNAPGKLKREMYADILAYILRFNEFPAAGVELDRRSEVLKSIRIDATRPGSP
jgi:mono/diheme cytochrome c family protein